MLRTVAVWLGGLLILGGDLAAQSIATSPRRVALLIGINEYQKPYFSELRYAEKDVEDVAVELTRVGFDVTTLLGQSATRDEIDAVAQRLVLPLSQHDVMLVMLCGHGVQLDVALPDGTVKNDAFFCPYDAVSNEPGTLYSLSHLIDDILAPNVGRKLLLVDACRNDIDAARGARSARGIEGKVIALPEDTAVMFSCRKGQKSFENDELTHGLFTYCVLEGLRGAALDDGDLSWSSLVAHVNKRMASSEFQKYLPGGGARQEPIPAGGVPYTVLARRSDLGDSLPERIVEKLPASAARRVTILNQGTNPKSVLYLRYNGGERLAIGPRDRSTIEVTGETIEFYDGSTWRRALVDAASLSPSGSLSFEVVGGGWRPNSGISKPQTAAAAAKAAPTPAPSTSSGGQQRNGLFSRLRPGGRR